jgi:3-oxoacyl-[acyl-carrier protein] reductase|tara:strand:+ start:192 stop:920 length:729 start_codon:yes stop_codon:yes gene_type:complete
MKNKKRHVLILGASSDIGIEVVKNFLQLKWKITAHFSKNKKKLEILKKTSKNLNTIKFNFANYNNLNIQKLMIKKFSGRYDSIINLIGYTDNRGFEKTNLNSILKSLTINAIIPILIEKMLVKRMLSQKWGRILNCSSIGVKFGGGKNSYNYSLAKHCLEFIPNSYKSWAKKNVFINNIRIGITDTKIHKRMTNYLNMQERVKFIPINRMAKPKEMAIYITNLTTDNNSYMTGQTITVSGGE